MKTAFDLLWGNESVKRRFSSDLAAHTLSHAYILEGPAGCGKSTLSDILAAGIGCGSDRRPCGECESCRKIFSHIAPDIVYVSLTDDRKTIGVEAVRNLRSQAYVKPTELDYRFFIIRDAQLMTPAAQNALLLLLEEPPAGVYFLLHCDSARSLLPTIRSRAPVIRMQQFSKEQLRDYLLDTEPAASALAERDPKAFDFALQNAAGCIGAAKHHIADAGTKDSLSSYDAIFTVLTKLRDRQLTDLAIFLERQKFTREQAVLMLSGLQNALRDLSALKYATAPALLFFHTKEEAEGYMGRLTRKNVMGIFSAVTEAKEQLSVNAHVGTTLILLSGRISRIIKGI